LYGEKKWIYFLNNFLLLHILIFFGSTLLAFNWFDSYFLRFLASLRSLYITFFLLLEVSFFPYMKSKLKICLIYFSIYRKPTTSKTPSFQSPFSLILSLSEILLSTATFLISLFFLLWSSFLMLFFYYPYCFLLVFIFFLFINMFIICDR
jgi:hypothetical protein